MYDYIRGLLFGYNPQHVFKFLVHQILSGIADRHNFAQQWDPKTNKWFIKANLEPEWHMQYKDYHPQSRMDLL